ncbi:hypothetical protein CAL26_05110 [Bordetella genomosp. 9]|uniref:Uncharacterized protein n=1 Tax=Bordetella genomosp. 9 TaxID=1416803 RepID=A0A261RQZ1_9BORD|nr:hypothetical protein [Bordetella genomosp. 9]OZI26703.1 hypothetical protein CAL26_05110 [Bordetella genomosp. 9]
MTWRHRWELGDPAKVYERIEAGKRNKERRELKADPFGAIWRKGVMVMDRDDSERIEELLMTWYEWARAYRPALGAPKVSPYGRGADSSDVYADGDEIDSRLRAADAEAVDACLNELTWQARAAVGLSMAEKASDARVLRNPSMTLEEAHQHYQQAKLDLVPLLRRRGMLQMAA